MSWTTFFAGAFFGMFVTVWCLISVWLGVNGYFEENTEK